MVRADRMTEFFENSEIFITGGSGVVGKAIIEKLLRSCNVRRIYVLLRPKRQLSADQRLRKVKQARIFQVLNVEKPNEVDKLIAIPGDVALPGLGIDEEHLQMLQRVSIIYNCAATVRFDEPLRVALRLNVGGTLEALKIAEKLQHLRIFVHISTFFSNPYLMHVEPKHYSSPMDWRLCLRLIDEVSDDNLLDTLTRKLIVGFPNTYTFTKNLSESLVNDYHTRVPLIVYRPSIVLFSANEPIPGYAPSLMGALGLFALVGSGLLKSVYLRDNLHLDITPQDLGIKSLCYYTIKGSHVYQQRTPQELLVYQSSSRSLLSFTFRQLAERMDEKQVWGTAPFLQNVLLPGCVYTQNRFIYKLIVFTMQVLPALLIDLLLQLFRRPPILMSIIRKCYLTLEVMKPFLFNNYDSPGCSDIDALIDFTDNTDFSVREIINTANTWETVDDKQKEMIKSIRHDLLKEDPSTLTRAKHILNIKKVISKLIRYYLLYKLLNWVWYRFLAQHFHNLT